MLSMGIIVLGVSTALARNISIEGRVLTAKDSTSLVGATVKLLDASHANIVSSNTDAKGFFSIKNIDKPPMLVVVSFVGFETQTIQLSGISSDTNLGNIYLTESSTSLQEVAVLGTLHQANRRLVFPSKTQIKLSTDMFSLLENLSLNALSVNQLNKSATIHSKPIYWRVNGIPRSEEEIKHISPSNILRIDYSAMPSIREIDQGYGGIINIILREKRDGGSLYAQLQQALWTGFNNSNISANYHKGKSDLSLEYGISHRNYPHWERSLQQSFIGKDKVINRDEKPESSPFKQLGQNINLSYVYQASEHRQLSATWRNTFGSQSLDIRNLINETDKQPFRRSSKSQYQSYRPALDLFLMNTFANGSKLEANLVGTLSIGRNERELVDQVNGIQTEVYSNPVKTAYYSIIAELNYAKSLHPKAYLSLGLQNTYAYSANEYLSPSYNLDQLYQNNTYGYGQILGRISQKLQYQIGTGAKLLHIVGRQGSKTYLKSQNSLALSCTPTSRLSLSLNSQLTPHLPTLAQLSEIQQHFDALSVYTGNRTLKPSYEFNNRVDLNYSKAKFTTSISLQYRHVIDPLFTRVSYLPKRDYFLFQTDNGKYNKQYGAELKIRYRSIKDILSLYSTIGVNRYESNVGTNPLQMHSLYWDLSAQLVYNDFVFSAFYRKSGATLLNETITYTGDNAVLTFIWNKKYWRLYAQIFYLGLPDGDSYFHMNKSKVNPNSSTIRIPNNGNMLTLGFIWNFDFGKGLKKTNRHLQNYDRTESAVKVQD